MSTPRRQAPPASPPSHFPGPLPGHAYGYRCNRCKRFLDGPYAVDPHDLDNPHDNEFLCYPCAEVTPNSQIPRYSSRFREGMKAGILLVIFIELAILLFWWTRRR